MQPSADEPFWSTELAQLLNILLAKALVITVEPTIYIPVKNIAILIEDMILFNQRGDENLSGSGHSALGSRPRSVNGFRGCRFPNN